MDQQIKKEQESVDNIVITTSMILFGAGIAFASTQNISQKPVSIALVLSLVCSVVSFSLTIWHKIRDSYRKSIMENIHKKIINTWTDKITDLCEDVLWPYFITKIADVISKSGADYKEARKQVLGDKALTGRTSLEIYLQSMGKEMEEAYRKTYHRPLDEKNSKVNFFLDIIARKFRYHIFAMALLFLLVSVGIYLLLIKATASG